MVSAAGRECEWDSLPHPTFNFWTIGNVSEILPGVVRPLTATLMRAVEYAATRRCAEWIDVLDLVPAYPPPVANFSGTFAGRQAINLAWANAIIATWQVSGPSGLLGQYITSTEGVDIRARQAEDTARAERILRRARRIWGRLGMMAARARARADALRARERGRDLTAMSERQLWRHILRLRGAQVKPLTDHLYVSGAAGDHTDRLNKLLDRALPGHDPGLVIALTSALRDVDSAAPAKAMWDVARFVAERKELADAVRRLAPHAIAARLQAPPDADWEALARRFQAFIAAHGYRGQREIDASAADWEEEPTFALSAIKTYLDAPEDRNPYVLEERAARAREAIETQIAPAIPRGLRGEYRELLAGAQKFTRLREYTKANWVRVCRTLRRPLRELGGRFAARGLIAEPDDIFWLVEEEVAAAVRGELDAATARGRVARRKAEAARLEETELPEVFVAPVTPAPRARPTMEGNVLTGMPVSTGKASGPARVVLSAEAAAETELLPGEVLVAPFTDAPWTPLFVPAAAVVVETGGILSHAATVAREYGIPAVVAVKGATKLIRTGQTVTVDGLTGTVTVA
jgi:phosphohistidine swiveling domain-containing protein